MLKNCFFSYFKTKIINFSGEILIIQRQYRLSLKGFFKIFRCIFCSLLLNVYIWLLTSVVVACNDYYKNRELCIYPFWKKCFFQIIRLLTYISIYFFFLLKNFNSLTRIIPPYRLLNTIQIFCRNDMFFAVFTVIALYKLKIT